MINHEAAAAAEHKQWMRWAQTLMDAETLSQERINRWMPYMVPYEELSDDVKEYDRVEARLLLAAALGDTVLYETQGIPVVETSSVRRWVETLKKYDILVQVYPESAHD